LKLGEIVPRKYAGGISVVQNVGMVGFGGPRCTTWGGPRDGLVRPDSVVIDSVLFGVLSAHDGVVDLVDVAPLELQCAEAAFA
jgi:hypothetical protein